jgi:hypothetical protein
MLPLPIEDHDMNVYDQVLEESKRFLAALPALLTSKLRGRWVVFKDGAVVGDFDTEAEALRAGIDRFGPKGGFVVDNVREHRPIRLFACQQLF